MKEKERKLTNAELKRKAIFEKVCKELEQKVLVNMQHHPAKACCLS